MSKKTWYMILECFANFKNAVFIGGLPGRWFEPQRGVHQGAPLSMRLYQVYVNDLLKMLKECGHGFYLGDINVSCPAFADDVSTGSIFKSGLNQMLDIAYRYGIKWKYEYSNEKCVYMVWGKDSSPSTPVKLGGNQLKRVEQCKHMGVELSENNSLQKDVYARRIGVCRKSLLAFRGIGTYNAPVTPSVMSNVYNSVCLTRMLYGIEVMHTTDVNLSDLEHAHLQHAKIIQIIPKNIATPTPLATLGWQSIKALITKAKILFLIRTLLLPDNNIYRRAALLMFNMYDHFKVNCLSVGICKMAESYGLWSTIFDLTHSVEFNYVTIKKKIKASIKEHDSCEWKATCLMYDNLNLYLECVPTIKLHTWWVVTQKVPRLYKQVAAIMAIIMGGQPRSMQKNFDKKLCQICNSRMADNSCHVIFDCRALNSVRTKHLERISRTMPIPMIACFQTMSKVEKQMFLLSPLNSTYIAEWFPIYEAIAVFIYDVYKVRAEMYEVLSE